MNQLMQQYLSCKEMSLLTVFGRLPVDLHLSAVPRILQLIAAVAEVDSSWVEPPDQCTC